MAKQNDRQHYDMQSKCRYYEKRVTDPKLTDGQRRFAQKRLNELCGGGKKPAQNKASSGKFTTAQTAAFNAGIGYGAAKANKRVPVREENKQSFRAGLERGKAIRQ